MTITFDAEIVMLVVAFIATGFKNCLELVDSRKSIFQCLLDGIGCPLLLVLAHDSVDDLLRMYPFVVVINLVTIGSNSARHYMNMVTLSKSSLSLMHLHTDSIPYNCACSHIPLHSCGSSELPHAFKTNVFLVIFFISYLHSFKRFEIGNISFTSIFIER